MQGVLVEGNRGGLRQHPVVAAGADEGQLTSNPPQRLRAFTAFLKALVNQWGKTPALEPAQRENVK